MWAKKKVVINFTPHLVPMNRGILITAYGMLKKEVSYEEVLETIQKRHKAETERKIAPLRQAQDAFLVDSTQMTIEEVVAEIKKIINQKMG